MGAQSTLIFRDAYLLTGLDLVLAAALFSAAIGIVNVILLIQSHIEIRNRNQELEKNSKRLESQKRSLDRHNRLLETLADLLIALYPDTDSPEIPATRKARKEQAIHMIDWAKRQDDSD